MIDSISFCVTALGRPPEQLRRCLDRIAAQKVPDHELLIGGVNDRSRPGTTFLYRAEWETASPAPDNELRNEFCKRATKPYVVLLDAGVELADGWYEELKRVDCFDVFGFALTDRSGKRALDWGARVTIAGESSEIPLEYDEWSPRAFVNGAALVMRRSVWEVVEFDEALGRAQGDDVDFCLRAGAEGYRLGVVPSAGATAGDEVLGARGAEGVARARSWMARALAESFAARHAPAGPPAAAPGKPGLRGRIRLWLGRLAAGRAA